MESQKAFLVLSLYEQRSTIIIDKAQPKLGNYSLLNLSYTINLNEPDFFALIAFLSLHPCALSSTQALLANLADTQSL